MSEGKILHAGLSRNGFVMAALAAAGLFNTAPPPEMSPAPARVKKRKLHKPADRSRKKHLLKGVRP